MNFYDGNIKDTNIKDTNCSLDCRESMQKGRSKLLRKKDRSPRIPFTCFQLNVLEKFYAADHYIKSAELTQLSKQLQLGNTKIKIWFQNRRARDQYKNRKGTVNSDQLSMKVKSESSSSSSPTGVSPTVLQSIETSPTETLPTEVISPSLPIEQLSSSSLPPVLLQQSPFNNYISTHFSPHPPYKLIPSPNSAFATVVPRYTNNFAYKCQQLYESYSRCN